MSDKAPAASQDAPFQVVITRANSYVANPATGFTMSYNGEHIVLEHFVDLPPFLQPDENNQPRVITPVERRLNGAIFMDLARAEDLLHQLQNTIEAAKGMRAERHE